MTPQSQPYVVHAPDGRILRFGRAPADDLSSQAGPGEAVVAGVGDDLADWVNPATGLIEQRPTIVLPAAVSLTVGAEWEIGLVPAGTKVVIDGSLIAETAGDALTLQFSVSATYHVELHPPFPWRRASSVVAVA